MYRCHKWLTKYSTWLHFEKQISNRNKHAQYNNNSLSWTKSLTNPRGESSLSLNPNAAVLMFLMISRFLRKHLLVQWVIWKPCYFLQALFMLKIVVEVWNFAELYLKSAQCSHSLQSSALIHWEFKRKRFLILGLSNAGMKVRSKIQCVNCKIEQILTASWNFVLKV